MAHATTIEWPNREKASSKLMRVLVLLALGVSSGLMLVVSVLGWDLMQDVKLAQIVFVAINVIFMIQIVRWSRGVLPMAAGLAVIVAIFAGVSVSSWYARDAPGYSDASLSATLGFLTAVIVVVQIVVIVTTIYAFTQNWQTEVEVKNNRRPAPQAPARADRGGSVPA